MVVVCRMTSAPGETTPNLAFKFGRDLAIFKQETLAGAPPVAGIVEEAWPSLEHVTDPMLFYCADGDPERSDGGAEGKRGRIRSGKKHRLATRIGKLR